MIRCQFETGVKTSLRHVVVDIVLTKGNKILLVKRSPTTPFHPNKYALPGGYLERDETIKEAAIREAREETGYEVKIMRLLMIVDNPQRKGEDKQNISFVFLAKPVKKIAKHDHEISQAIWFDLNKLPPPQKIAFDHWEIIQYYLEPK